MLNFKIEFFSGVFLICDPHWSRIMVQILFSFFFPRSVWSGPMICLCSALSGHNVHPWVPASHVKNEISSFWFCRWQSCYPKTARYVQERILGTDLTTLSRRIPLGFVVHTWYYLSLFSSATCQLKEKTLNMEKVIFQQMWRWIWPRFLARNSDQCEVATLKFLLSN